LRSRGKPGQLFYASSGVGGPNHLAGETFNRMAGIEIVHVPFPHGRSHSGCDRKQVGDGLIAGLIRTSAPARSSLAVGGKERSPALPDVPTVAEAGVAGYEATSWIGLLAPGTTAPR
jgi:tripartite-type tricarboxylate transporter receptor subunit TctC